MKALFLAALGATVSLCPAQNLLTNGNFEAEPYNDGWLSAGVAQFAGLAPGSLRSTAITTTGTGRIGQGTSTAEGNWYLDAWFAIKSTTNRSFSLLINQTAAGDNVNAATINLRCQSGVLETFSSATSSWGSLGLGTVLPSTDANADGDFEDPGDTKNIYHLRITGSAWGTFDSSYDVQLSEPNQTAFTRQAVGQSRYHNGSGNNGFPASFLFNAAFGTNPGFWVDDVTFENIVLPDDPNLGIPTPLPIFGTLPVDSGPVTRTITIANTGTTANLNVSAASFTGTDAAKYSVAFSPLSIPPQTTQELNVTFTPGAARGNFSATLNLTSNDTSSPLIPIALPAVVYDYGSSLIANGSFDIAPFPTPWITTGTLAAVPGLKAPSPTAAQLSGPGTGGVNTTAGLAVTAPQDWQLDFDLLVPLDTGRTFQLFVHTFGEPNRLDGAPLNIRIENGVFGAYNGTAWTDLPDLGVAASTDGNSDGDYEDAEDSKLVYRVSLTARAWATEAASYDLALTDANGTAFTRSARKLKIFVAGQGNARTSLPTSFLFSTAAVNNSGFTVDSVTFTAGAPPALPVYVPVEIAGFDGFLTLTWNPLPNTTYKIWSSPDLRNWTAGDSGLPGPTYEEQFVIPGKRFFRVEQE